jgi:chemotaxis methyl-accepting protein methylase
MLELHSPANFAFFMQRNPKLANAPLERRLEEFRMNGICTNTSFFRAEFERAQRDFKDIALPTIINEPIRVAFIGCSDGREPYSFLLYNWGARDRLKIDAYDTNLTKLEIAVCGGYPFSQVGESNLQTIQSLGLRGEAYYILRTKVNGVEHFSINFKREAKERINFNPHDILLHPLPQEYDVVFMLNVLMHYPDKGRERILKNIYPGLKDGGWLFCEGNAFWDPDKEWVQELSEWEKRDKGYLGFERANTPDAYEVYRRNSKFREEGK